MANTSAIGLCGVELENHRYVLHILINHTIDYTKIVCLRKLCYNLLLAMYCCSYRSNIVADCWY